MENRTLYLVSHDELTFDQMEIFVEVIQTICWAWSEIVARPHYIIGPGQDYDWLISWSATFVFQ